MKITKVLLQVSLLVCLSGLSFGARADEPSAGLSTDELSLRPHHPRPPGHHHHHPGPGQPGPGYPDPGYPDPYASWICYSHDFTGRQYYGRSYDRYEANDLALRACQYYSQTPVTVCFSDGCERQY